MATYSKLRSDDPRVQEARKRAGRIVNAMNELATLVQEAWDSGDHRTLGYETWQSYTVGEFGHGETAIKARQVIVAMLRGTGLSQRAIAAQTGASVGTVHNDLADLTAEPPEGDPATVNRYSTVQPVEQPDTVTGLDGRVRPATRGGMDGDERRARRRARNESMREIVAEAGRLHEQNREQEAAQYQRDLEENHRNAGRNTTAVAETPAREMVRTELDRRAETRILLAAKFNGLFRQWLDTRNGDQLAELEANQEDVFRAALAAIESWTATQNRAG